MIYNTVNRGDYIEPQLGNEYYYAHIILPPHGIYESIHMRCRTKDDDYCVLNNKNITYPVFKKDYDRIFTNKKECDIYLSKAKELHKGEKTYKEMEVINEDN